MEKRIIFAANCGEFEGAFEALSDGGSIVITDSFALRQAHLSKHSGKITVSGREGASLRFDKSVTLTLGGETAFENITFEVKTSGVIAADFNPLTFAEGVTVKSDLSVEANGLYIVGGENNSKNTKDSYDGDTALTIRSGTVSRLVGFSRGCDGRVHTGHASLEVGGDAYVRYVVAGSIGIGSTAGSASLKLSENAVIEAVHMGGAKEDNLLNGDMDITVCGGDIYRFDRVGLSAVKGVKSILYDPRTAPSGIEFLIKLARFDIVKTVCDINGHDYGEPYENPFDSKTLVHTCKICNRTELVGEEPRAESKNVVFAADGGFGSGSSPSCPICGYGEAVEKLGKDGGTVVLVGKCTVKPNLFDQFERVHPSYQEPRHSGNITVTCVHGGIDYRGVGACLVFDGDVDYRMSGPLTLVGIKVEATDKASSNRIIARYNPIVVGDDCVTPTREDYSLDIIGGYLEFRYTDLDGCDIESEYEEIVNYCRPLPDGYVIDDLEPLGVNPAFSLRRDAARAFDRMFEDMGKEGLKIPTVTDATRPYARQYALFTGYLCRLRRTFGYDFETARRVVMRSCGLPNCSEHQQGVAVDMYDTSLTMYGGKKHHYFDITPEWAWVSENGKKYGILLRYPNDKTDITGCIYEAWHFRYVGKDVASVLKARGYTLEEYMGAKLGLHNLDSSVTVNSGSFNTVTAFSRDVGLLQMTGKHFISVSKNANIRVKTNEASEC